jgi:phosphoribosylamine--glycine ligase
VVLPRIQNDLFELLQATASGTLDSIKLSIDKRSVSTIVAVSGGYPESYDKGKAICGIDPSDFVVHAGTAMVDEELVTSGGRVLSATGVGADHNQAIAQSYQALAKIDFEGIYYRKDIGFDL